MYQYTQNDDHILNLRITIIYFNYSYIKKLKNNIGMIEIF
jgi:hypothetical protein